MAQSRCFVLRGIGETPENVGEDKWQVLVRQEAATRVSSSRAAAYMRFPVSRFRRLPVHCSVAQRARWSTPVSAPLT